MFNVVKFCFTFFNGWLFRSDHINKIISIYHLHQCIDSTHIFEFNKIRTLEINAKARNNFGINYFQSYNLNH